MTTPPNPQQGGQPYPGQQPAPYGTGYGGAVYHYPAGQEPPPTQQAPGAYPYSPYGGYGGGQYPAGLDDKRAQPVPRPASMIVALVLKVLAALPFLVLGGLFLIVPITPADIPPETLADVEALVAGATAEDVISSARIVAGVFAGLAVVYIAIAVVAFTGRNWARILVAVMTGGFTAVLLLGALGGGAADVASLLILLTPVVLSVAGVALLFRPDAGRFFAAPRRQ